MRKAINILRNSDAQYPMMSEDGIVSAIKEAMIEAIKECAEKVKVKSVPCGDIRSCGCEGICEHPYFTVDKQSILSLIEQIK